MDNPPKNFYQILNIPNDATEETIIEAGKALLKKSREASSPSDLSEQTKVNEALDALLSKENRKKYDKLLSDAGLTETSRFEHGSKSVEEVEHNQENDPRLIFRKCTQCGYPRHAKYTDTSCPLCMTAYPPIADVLAKEKENLKTLRDNAALENSAPVKCPKCGNTQICGGERGFNVKKAALGLALGWLAPIPGGVLWGLHGRKAVLVSCLKCGHRWKPSV